MSRVRRSFEVFPDITVVHFKFPSRTVRDSDVVNSCDIHFLYRNLLRFGTAYPGRLTRPTRKPEFVQTVQPQDLASALSVVSQAREEFDKLPVEVRDRFNYNPYRFMEFVTDEKNASELVKMGLADVVKPVKSLAQEVAEIIKPTGELGSKPLEGQA